MLISAALALIAAPVALAVEDPGNVEAEPLAALLDPMVREIERRTGERCALVLSLPADCASERCLTELRARTESEDVVLVRTFASPSLFRVIATRVSPSRTSSGSADVPRRPLGTAPLTALAAQLFREKHAFLDHAALAPAVSTSVGWLEPLPLGLMAATVIAAGAGVGFGIASRATKGSIEDQLLFEREYTGSADTLSREAWTANVLFGIAGASLLSWGAVLIFE